MDKAVSVWLCVWCVCFAWMWSVDRSKEMYLKDVFITSLRGWWFSFLTEQNCNKQTDQKQLFTNIRLKITWGLQYPHDHVFFIIVHTLGTLIPQTLVLIFLPLHVEKLLLIMCLGNVVSNCQCYVELLSCFYVALSSRLLKSLSKHHSDSKRQNTLADNELGIAN